MGLGINLGSVFKQDKSRTNQSANTQQWSSRVNQAVEDAFLNALGQMNYNRLGDLSDALAGKALDYNIDVDPIIAEARRQATMDTGQKFQSLARQAGSDANSLVNLAYNEAVLGREDNLAALRAELEAQNQQGQLDALANAIQGSYNANASILGLGNLLKGANVDSTALTKSKAQTWQNSLGMGLSGDQAQALNFTGL